MNRELRQDRRATQGAQKGAVLLVVLVFVFLLSFITMQFVSEVGEKLQYRVQTGGDAELRRVAMDGWTHAVAVLAEIQEVEGSFYSGGQGWSDPFAYEPMMGLPDGIVLESVVEDLTGRLSLTAMDEETLRLFLESIGWNLNDASRLTDLYFDWIDEDDLVRVQGAESREYRSGDRSNIKPRNAMIKRMEEFRQIRGFREWFLSSEPELVERRERFLRSLTLMHTAPANINSASPAVLNLIGKVDMVNPIGVAQYMAGRDRIAGTGDDRYFEDVNHPYLMSTRSSGSRLSGVQSHAFRVTVRASRPGLSQHVVSAIVREPSETSAESAAASGTDPAEADPETADPGSVGEETAQEPAVAPGADRMMGLPFEILELSENIINAQD